MPSPGTAGNGNQIPLAIGSLQAELDRRQNRSEWGLHDLPSVADTPGSL